MNTIAPEHGAPTHLVSDSHGVRYEPDASTPAEHRTGTIVVGVDGSASSVEALRRGIRMANALHTSVRAVASWRFPLESETYAAVAYSPEADARSFLADAAAAAFGEQPPAWFTTETHEGMPAEVLIEQSAHADMLVVGSRGHGGLAGVLLGSVSAICAEHAHCPVLIIH